MLNKGWIKIAPGKNPQIRVDDIKKIPIAKTYKNTFIVKNIVENVIDILNNIDSRSIIVSLAEIDKLVYILYDLSENEIKIIEQCMNYGL